MNAEPMLFTMAFQNQVPQLLLQSLEHRGPKGVGAVSLGPQIHCAMSLATKGGLVMLQSLTCARPRKMLNSQPRQEPAGSQTSVSGHKSGNPVPATG